MAAIEQLKTVKEVFESIFPDPEVGKCYLSVLSLCLSGEHPEKLFVANGHRNESSSDVRQRYGSVFVRA